MDDRHTQRNFVLSGNLIGEFTDSVSHTVIFGAEYIYTSSDQDRYNAFWDTTSDDNEIFAATRPLNLRGGVGVNASGQTTRNDYTADLNDDTRVGINVFSAYIQDEIELNHQWDAVIGARFDSFDIDVFNVLATENRSRADDEISPRLGLVFKPQENVSLYGSYSESFLPRSGEQFANINGSTNQLDPNTFSNLEAGVKWDINQAVNLTFSLFEEQFAAGPDSDPSTLDVIDSEITGYELQLQGRVTDNWYVSAGYSNLDGEQVSRSGSTVCVPENCRRTCSRSGTICK